MNWVDGCKYEWMEYKMDELVKIWMDGMGWTDEWDCIWLGDEMNGLMEWMDKYGETMVEKVEELREKWWNGWKNME